MLIPWGCITGRLVTRLLKLDGFLGAVVEERWLEKVQPGGPRVVVTQWVGVLELRCEVRLARWEATGRVGGNWEGVGVMRVDRARSQDWGQKGMSGWRPRERWT